MKKVEAEMQTWMRGRYDGSGARGSDTLYRAGPGTRTRTRTRMRPQPCCTLSRARSSPATKNLQRRRGRRKSDELRNGRRGDWKGTGRRVDAVDAGGGRLYHLDGQHRSIAVGDGPMTRAADEEARESGLDKRSEKGSPLPPSSLSRFALYR